MENIKIQKVYDNTELKFAMKVLRKVGVVARLNLSTTESDKILDTGKPYLISQAVSQNNYKEDGIVYLYFNSADHEGILATAQLLNNALIHSQMMWDGSVSTCIKVQTPHKLYVNGELAN